MELKLIASSLFRHGSVAGLTLALVLSGAGPTVAGEARHELIRQAHQLLERHQKCEASLRVARQRRYEASRKPYLSDQDRQKDWGRLDLAVEAEKGCVSQAAAELQQSLAALEIQAQRDLAEAQAKLRQPAPAERPALETARSEAAAAAKWARFQRLQREQLERLRIREADCEQGAKDTTELMKSNVLRQPNTEGVARTYREQEVFEQERQNFLSCAENARQQQAQILAALGGHVSVGTAEGRAAFARDVQGLLRALQEVAAQLDDRQTLRHDEFAARMARLSRDLETFKARYAQFLADRNGAPLARQLLQAGELVVTSAATWQRTARVQDRAQRDVILREVAAQWLRFQNLVREAAELAGRASAEESGQASPGR